MKLTDRPAASLKALKIHAKVRFVVSVRKRNVRMKMVQGLVVFVRTADWVINGDGSIELLRERFSY